MVFKTKNHFKGQETAHCPFDVMGHHPINDAEHKRDKFNGTPGRIFVQWWPRLMRWITGKEARWKKIGLPPTCNFRQKSLTIANSSKGGTWSREWSKKYKTAALLGLGAVFELSISDQHRRQSVTLLVVDHSNHFYQPFVKVEKKKVLIITIFA